MLYTFNDYDPPVKDHARLVSLTSSAEAFKHDLDNIKFAGGGDKKERATEGYLARYCHCL